jgi:rhodanese-related sulfurtransferase
MAGYAAENRMSGFSPSVTVSELDGLIDGKNVVFIDVRDIFAYQKSHVKSAMHISLEYLARQINTIPEDRLVIVYDETGKKGHQALRTLLGKGFKEVVNLSGGHVSLQRQGSTVGFKNLQIDLLPVEKKSLHEKAGVTAEKAAPQATDHHTPIVVDVRTVEEFRTGAYPGAVNIPLDELSDRVEELGENAQREITVYCASGARSAYAQRMLSQMGFYKVENGGGIAAMMARRNTHTTTESVSSKPIVVDVRTPGEYRGGAFPGAINIPVDDLPKRINELGPKSKEIILYCASGARSAYGQKVLNQLGFTNVKNGGGIMQMMMKNNH